jgi:hypothetical protein
MEHKIICCWKCIFCHDLVKRRSTLTISNLFPLHKVTFHKNSTMKLGARRAHFIDDNGLDDQAIGVQFPAGEESPFFKASSWLWGPLILLSIGYWRQFPQE